MFKGLRYPLRITFFLVVLCIVSACTSLGPHYSYIYNGEKVKTYSIYRPFVGVCEYMDGYWNNWSRDEYLRYKVKKTNIGFEIVYFNKLNHPSDFEYKIIVKQNTKKKTKKKTKKDSLRPEYNGEIHIKASNEIHMRSKYKKKMAGVEALKDVWVFPATIKRTTPSSFPEKKYVIPTLPAEMMYVYKVFYNGVGRAFKIKGLWVGADKLFDPWI